MMKWRKNEVPEVPTIHQELKIPAEKGKIMFEEEKTEKKVLWGSVSSYSWRTSIRYE